MAVSLNGDGTITGLSTLDSVTITGLTSLTTTDLTADTTTLVVDSANDRVGIGTGSPSKPLHLYSTSLTNPLRVETAQAFSMIEFYASGTTGVTSFGATGNTLVGFTNNTERMRIDSSGYVGIGTSSPAFSLDVASGSSTYIRAQRTVSGSEGSILIGAATSENQIFSRDITTGNKPLAFYTGTTERMRITSDGNVGIGTSSPATRLSFGNYIPANGQTLHIYQSGNVRSGLGVVAGVYRNYTSSDASLSFGHVSTSDGSTYTERMRIDSSGNVGIGTSSPSYKLHVKPTSGSPVIAAEGAGTNQAGFFAAIGADAGSYPGFQTRQGATHYWSIHQRGNTNLHLYREAGAGNVIIDSGNVGIGTSSPIQKLDVNGGLQMYSTNKIYFFSTGYSIHAQDGLEFETADYMKFQTGGANERMRIDSSGNLLVGTTTPGTSPATGFNVTYASGSTYSSWGHVNGTGAGQPWCVFSYNSTVIGSITQNGTTATSFNTSSDYRLKENVTPMSGSINRLKQLKPSTWSWVQDGSHGEGFLAHEAQSVVPEAVTGTKDAVDDEGNPVYQGIDQSKLVPLLTAALQEAITKIEDLETRIQALENPS